MTGIASLEPSDHLDRARIQQGTCQAVQGIGGERDDAAAQDGFRRLVEYRARGCVGIDLEDLHASALRSFRGSRHLCSVLLEPIHEPGVGEREDAQRKMGGIARAPAADAQCSDRHSARHLDNRQ